MVNKWLIPGKRGLKCNIEINRFGAKTFLEAMLTKSLVSFRSLQPFKGEILTHFKPHKTCNIFCTYLKLYCKGSIAGLWGFDFCFSSKFE